MNQRLVFLTIFACLLIIADVFLGCIAWNLRKEPPPPVSHLIPTVTVTEEEDSEPTKTARSIPTPEPTKTPIVQATTPAVPAILKDSSPYLLGTNLGLFDDHDQAVTSSATQNQLRQMHVSLIRIPTRHNNSESLNRAALQAIKAIGATPLIIVRGGQDPDVGAVLADDKRMVQAANDIFPGQTVWYEFGNEDDLNGVKMSDYIARWQQVVPQLKAMAPNSKWIGPVSYQYSHANLSQFLTSIHPDAVSWHEYTCSLKWEAYQCLANLDHWNQHIQDARGVMNATVHAQLPIFISEWNYCPDQTIQSNGKPLPDGKWDNDAFLISWTQKALQILASNHVYGAAQYSATNTALPLVDSAGNITTQGTVFRDYK